MNHLIPDIRFAMRRFMRAPILTLAAIVTLALGIGANTAVFSLVDGIWLRPLPIADPAHLVGLQSVKNHAAANSELADTTSSYAELVDVREGVPAFADVAGVDRRGVALDTGDGVQLLLAEVVTDNYFTFMGESPELGRLPSESELRREQAPVIVLSHATWMRVFGGDRGVIGHTVNVRHGSATVLAVMPSGFRGTERVIDPEVYVPRSTWVMWSPDELKASRTFRQFELYARLRPGATLDQAKGQLQSLSTDLAGKYPQTNNGRTFAADWQVNSNAGGLKALSLLLLAIAGAVLLIACTNIANLLMALHDSRRREVAMRVALGATRVQLLRQLVTEYSVLALAGVASALMVAQELISLVPALMPNLGFPLGFDFQIDHRVMAFAVVAGVVSLLFFGLVPAIASTRVSPLAAMRAQIGEKARFKMPARKILVVAQLAGSMALLIATGMLVKALVHVQNMNMGFNPTQNAVLMEFSMDGNDPHQQQEFEDLVARMKALPGVKAASVSRVMPFADVGAGATKLVLAPGEIASPTAGTPVWFNLVDNAYFQALQIPIVRGRAFNRQDTRSSGHVLIVNQTMARQLFGSEDVIGKHLRMGREDPVDAEIVGVALNGKYADVAETPQPYLYLPSSQYNWSDWTLIATTTGDPRPLISAARKVAREVDPNIITISTQTLTDRMNFATYTNRMAAWLTASLGGLALLLTAVGLYGVTAYSVSRRAHEIGIRMALGALRGNVFATVLKDGLKLTLIGIGLGSGGALLLARGMSSLLFGVKPLDPIILLAAIGVIIATSVIALAAPARRALRVDPVAALREE